MTMQLLVYGQEQAEVQHCASVGNLFELFVVLCKKKYQDCIVLGTEFPYDFCVRESNLLNLNKGKGWDFYFFKRRLIRS